MGNILITTIVDDKNIKINAESIATCDKMDVSDSVTPFSYEKQHYISTDADIETDAVDDTKTDVDSISIDDINLIINIESVTLEKVHAIEDMLNVSDKISLIYLLYENGVEARDQIKDLLLEQETSKPIYEWAKENEENEFQWRRSLLEALSIIQHYRILRTQFGYEKTIVNKYFFPFNKCIAQNINILRKVLFLIFDNLPSATVREILDEIKTSNFFNGNRKTFKIPNKNTPFYFELCLLDLEKLNFISNNNVKNLIAIFKKMELYNQEDDLKNLIKENSTRSVSKEDKNFEKEKKMFLDINIDKPKSKLKMNLEQDNTNQAALTQEQQLLTLPSISNGSILKNCYAMNELAPGIALIISNEYFYTETDEKYKNLLPKSDQSLHYREGTEVDVRRLQDTFRYLNFSEECIILKRNRKHIDILQDIREAAYKVTKENSCLFVTIMTHGENEILYGANSCSIEIQELQKIMSSSNTECLEGKPKILILQCCQGSKCQTLESNDDYNSGYETDSPERLKKSCLPKSVDNFTFLATVPGYSAIRHKTAGTWFIQTFCEVLQELSNSKDFIGMCTEVVGRVSKKVWNTQGQSRCMVPLQWSTFRKELYLPPILLKKQIPIT